MPLHLQCSRNSPQALTISKKLKVWRSLKKSAHEYFWGKMSRNTLNAYSYFWSLNHSRHIISNLSQNAKKKFSLPPHRAKIVDAQSTHCLFWIGINNPKNHRGLSQVVIQDCECRTMKYINYSHSSMAFHSPILRQQTFHIPNFFFVNSRIRYVFSNFILQTWESTFHIFLFHILLVLKNGHFFHKCFSFHFKFPRLSNPFKRRDLIIELHSFFKDFPLLFILARLFQKCFHLKGYTIVEE